MVCRIEMECTSIQIKSMKQPLQSTTMSDTVDLLHFNKSCLTKYGILTMRLSMAEHVWTFHDGRTVYTVLYCCSSNFHCRCLNNVGFDIDKWWMWGSAWTERDSMLLHRGLSVMWWLPNFSCKIPMSDIFLKNPPDDERSCDRIASISHL